ncbi:MAG: UDP-3-O-(3-hydroxymyristoyl)glucosamine N-acyltransferase [Chitinophagaceae bacterium]|nr:UDP-3-O-(3-hydroxymyristoyl)glucosamine N-acyltransferase [Chitinophagaceae bacterium]
MEFTAAQIALMISGQVEGDPNTAVSSFGKIEEAQPGQLSFLANPKYEEYLYRTGASIIIINESLELKEPVKATLIKVQDAYTAFATLLDKYQQIERQQLKGIQQPVYIDATAKTGENVFIGAFAYLGKNVVVADGSKIFPHVFLGENVQVGENCIIHPGVKIYHDCIIGSNVTIHAGTVIGSDGFGFAPQPDGTFRKVPQIGNVVIEDHVEVGANATIDRATIGSTLIRSGAKLDNLVQIAHNVEVGNNTVIAALAGVSGSSKIGNGVMIGGQAGIAGHLQIADGCKINAQSGLGKSLKTPGTSVTGSPAYDYSSAIRSQATARNLPQLEKRVMELESLLASMMDKK